MIVSVADFSEQFPAISKYTDEQELAELLGAFTLREVPKGSIVLQEGEFSSSLHLVWKGTLTVHIEHGGNALELGCVNAGQWFGEVAMLDPGAVTASVTATTDCVLLTLSEENFRMLDRQHPSVTSKILRMLSTELVERINASDGLLYGLADGPPQTDDESPEEISEWAKKMYRILFKRSTEA